MCFEVSKWNWGSYRIDGVTFLKIYIVKYDEDGTVIYEYGRKCVLLAVRSSSRVRLCTMHFPLYVLFIKYLRICECSE
jgi:hypothetical protein